MNPHDAKIGDTVTPIDMWNRTSPRRKLPLQCLIHAIKAERNCQTGIMFKVKSTQGHFIWLDAAWFREHERFDPEPDWDSE